MRSQEAGFFCFALTSLFPWASGKAEICYQVTTLGRRRSVDRTRSNQDHQTYVCIYQLPSWSDTGQGEQNRIIQGNSCRLGCVGRPQLTVQLGPAWCCPGQEPSRCSGAPHPCQLQSCLARLKKDIWAKDAFSFLQFELKTSSQVYLQGTGETFVRAPNDEGPSSCRRLKPWREQQLRVRSDMAQDCAQSSDLGRGRHVQTHHPA